MLAVQSFGIKSSQRRLARADGPEKDKRVANLPTPNQVGEEADCVVLPNNIVESLRAILLGERRQ
jgi:hypothetical protein